MYVKTLFLRHFRNFNSGHFDFCPTMNLICGPNARGKTSLLEALFLLVMGRSFRPGHHVDLIAHGETSALVDALFCKHSVDQRLQIHLFEKERKIIHNATPLHNLSSLFGTLQGVIMSPDDAHLIKGAPSLRRQFLDSQIAQIDPLYVYYLSRYTKALAHRNQLLRQKITLSIDTFEHEMAKAAGYVITKRKEALSGIGLHAKKFYSFLTNESEELSFTYLSAAAAIAAENEIALFYKEQYYKQRIKEMSAGHTLIGPHKDDFGIYLKGKEAKYFGSEGQQRSAAIALRIGEWVNLKYHVLEKPLLMIDDFGISLDAHRKKRLLEWVALDLGQVFITSTDASLLDIHKGEKVILSL